MLFEYWTLEVRNCMALVDEWLIPYCIIYMMCHEMNILNKYYLLHYFLIDVGMI